MTKYFLITFLVSIFTVIEVSGQSLSGTFTVGGTAPDYTSLSAAISDLNINGVNGPVTLNIRPGNYQEQVVIPSITGASSTNTITIQSENQDSTSVVFTHYGMNSSTNYTIKLDGADFFRIQNITIEAQGNSYNCALLCINACQNNIFSNNLFKSNSTAGNSNRKLVSLGGTNSSSNVFQNNYFRNGGYALSVGSTSNIVIKGNVFSGIGWGGGIYLGNVTDVDFSENFKMNTGNIHIHGCKGNILFEKNEIYKSHYLTLEDLDHPNSEALVTNNFLGTTVRFTRSSNVRFVHNSVNKAGCVYFTSPLSNIEIYNNVFNAPGNYQNEIYSSYNQIDSSEVSSDYNLFYSNKDNCFRDINVSLNFNDWSNQTGLDQNSFFGIINYVSDTNLHSNNSLLMNDKGTPLPYVMSDIDGEIRSLTAPDIGADEFDIDSSTYHNIELYNVYNPDTSTCTLSDSLGIEVVNHSSFEIDSLIIKWWLYGSLQDSNIYYVNLPSHDTTKINLQEFIFNTNTLYNIEVEISAPNGQIDNYFNDNRYSLGYYNIDGVKIFKKSNPMCSTDQILFIKNFPHDSILWSNGETDNNTIISSPGVYSVTVTDSRGCTVTDSITIN